MGGDMDEIKKDPRFAHIVKDARFKRLPKKHVKVKVDKRFQSMFTDKKFQIKCHVDKRGRPLDIGASEDLKRYYDLSDSDEDSEKSERKEDQEDDIEESIEEEEKSIGESNDSESEVDKKSINGESKEKEKPRKGVSEEAKNEYNIEKQTQNGDCNKLKKKERPDKKLLNAQIKRKLRDKKIDYARGEGKLFSESSSEEESVNEDSEYEEHDWGELDNDAEMTEEATNRLAICNMDWDRIKAVDLMVLFHSFLPAGGLIHSVTIYPSEFGTQRMKEEEENGPIELKELKTENEEEEMHREHMEKLRKYQLNRLKYYYAIMVCDTKETANSLYNECDGLEYECSAVKLDLRFVPDDTTFDQEAKDVCTSLPDLSTYKPRLFQTTALTRSKVELTWDENDPDREELIRSVHTGNIDEDKLKEYLAYSSSEEEDGCEEAKTLADEPVEKVETEQSAIEKYKSLIADIESNEAKKKNNEVNLEVTWNLKLENKANEMVKEKLKDKDNMTPFEQYIDKKREKKKKKKQERMMRLEENEKGSDKSAFSDDDIPADVDLDDPYFKEELDRTETKKKKKNLKKAVEPETEEQKYKKAELELLMLDDCEDKHFSLKKIEERENTSKKFKGKKRKAETESGVDDFKIDVKDERFAALYTSHHFNIDPTDPRYKPTKATKELIEEKLRRRELEERTGKSRKMAENGKQKNTELNVLVKNIKNNAAELRWVK